MDWKAYHWKTVAWWGGVVVSVLVTLLFAVGLPLQLQRQVTFLLDGERTAALVVTDVECHGSEPVTCTGDIRFQTSGGELYTVEVAVPNGAERGDAYWIRYVRDDPTDATLLNRNMLIAAIVLLAAGHVGLVVGVVWGVRYVRRTITERQNESPHPL